MPEAARKCERESVPLAPPACRINGNTGTGNASGTRYSFERKFFAKDREVYCVGRSSTHLPARLTDGSNESESSTTLASSRLATAVWIA